MSENGDSHTQTTVRIVLEATFHGEDWLQQANAISDKAMDMVPEDDFHRAVIEEIGIMICLERFEDDASDG